MLLPTDNTIRSVKKLITESISPLYSTGEAASIAAVYLEDKFGLDRTEQALNERRITESEINKLNEDLIRLIDGEPLQYITGKASFCGLDFHVDGSVLIPRPETEELVQAILNDHEEAKLNLLDIGTGSGCIPIVIKRSRPSWKVAAMDISVDALEVAAKNAKANSVDIDFHHSDILKDDMQFRQLDIIVSNPPYVGLDEAGQIRRNVLVFEPHLALFPQCEDGLSFYKRIGLLGANWLKKGGKLYFEVNETKGGVVREILQALGYADSFVLTDIHGKDRFVRATWPG